MCGITGIYAFNELGRFCSINLQQANEAMLHRGPDCDRLYTDYFTSFGHRRLSIIDTSSDGNQPMSDSSGRYTIVFNGEIYNFQALRKPLQEDGEIFNSNSDTEVLLKLYIKYKENCLDKLNGFFAFAIHDKEENSLFIARDRMGIKPLLYFMDEDKFIFASEMNALLAFKIPKVVDHTSVYQYFQFNYIPAPNTIFQNVFKLLPGHYIKLKGRNIKIKEYYKPPFNEDNTVLKLASYSQAQNKLIRLLDNSVRERLIADVPLGSFLSGGIDSSIIVALASNYTKNLNTFSIGYKDEPFFDETKYANLVAKKYNTNHTVFKLTNDDYFEHIFNLLDFYAEPFADSSAIPLYILTKKTKKKVTVALSGDGADELFAGYHKYYAEYKARENGTLVKLLKASLPILDLLPKTRGNFLGNKIRQMHRFAEAMHKSPQERYYYLSSWKSEKEVSIMFTDTYKSNIYDLEYQQRKAEILKYIKNTGFNDVLYSDIHLLLPNDMLHKVDSMSMANSLEVRVPFLDHNIVDFAFNLPSYYKIDGRMKKKVLQDAARHLLPKELYNRPKKGFEVPLVKGFKKELRSWIEYDLFEDDLIREQNIFNPKYIHSLKNTIFNTNNFDQNKIWGILAFQHWWKKVMVENKSQ